MTEQAKTSTQTFLDSLLADTAPSPLGENALKEMQEEISERNKESAKSQLRQAADLNEERLLELRKLDKRRREIKDSMGRIRGLAQKVVEGTVDTTEDSFYEQLSTAGRLPGRPIVV